MKSDRVYLTLTRRNLESLLKKLDRPESARTIIKTDTVHPTHPLRGAEEVWVTAVENEEYYTDRTAGVMYEELHT